jgi:Flp pilus assembly protein CpaB
VGATRPLPSRRILAARPRRRLATRLRRQPLVFWCLAALAAISTYLVVQSALEATVEGAAVYGDLVEVAVATTNLAPGAVIEPGDVAVLPLPRSLVPQGATSDDLAGRSVRHPIVAGEAVVAQRLAPDGAVGVAAMLGPGERAVAIPLPSHRAPLEVGQLVDVLATVDPDSTRGRSPTSVVAEDAAVVAVDDGGVTVSAPADDAARIATALSYAVVSVAISG